MEFKNIQQLGKEIVIDDTEAIILASGNEYTPSGVECPYCKKDIDISDLVLKIKNRTKIQILKQVCEKIKLKIKEILKDELEFDGSTGQKLEHNPKIKILRELLKKFQGEKNGKHKSTEKRT